MDEVSEMKSGFEIVLPLSNVYASSFANKIHRMKIDSYMLYLFFKVLNLQSVFQESSTEVATIYPSQVIMLMLINKGVHLMDTKQINTTTIHMIIILKRKAPQLSTITTK